MAERVETVVIGAGQAGLCVSHHLRGHGREHVVLERGAVAETWRSERWDGFCLNTPNWSLRLPGHEYDGPDPEGFSPLAGVIDYLERYAHGAPVRTGVEATAVRRRDDGWTVEADRDYDADNVVVATGAFQRPYVPPVAAQAPEDIEQLDATAYRRPDQLPPGAVLVVGSGQSGCQIADELLDAGRDVYLAVGSCPWLPRRYRGRDIVHWALEIGLMDETVGSLPSPTARLACNPAVSGNDGGHDCNPRWLARRGATPVGRLVGFDGHRATFGPGLEQTLASGDEFVANLTARIDEHIRAAGLDAPPPEPAEAPAPLRPLDTLDLREAGVGTILWACGFRPAFEWVETALDADGWPVQTRGASVDAGLYFVGLQWLHTRKSALLLGVGEDAEHVAARIAA